MSNRNVYSLTKEAKSDLEHIIDYTYENFGISQVEKYVRQLEVCSEKLACSEIGVRTIIDNDLEIRFIKCQKHYVFGFEMKQDDFRIIAFFHERMDLKKQVVQRLNALGK